MVAMTDLVAQGLLMRCLKNLAENLDMELRPNAADRVREAIAEIERLETKLIETGAIVGFMIDALDGKASDFALSVGPVMRVDDLRLEHARLQRENERLRGIEQRWLKEHQADVGEY